MRQMIGLAAATAATLLLLTGCASTPEGAASTAAKLPAETSTEASPQGAASPEPENLDPESVRVPGEVCDPSNANDAICAAFHPEAAALNMFERLPSEISDLPTEQQAQLADDACDVLVSGGAPTEKILASSPTVDAQFGAGTTNNLLYAVAGYGFCQDQLSIVDPSGAWLVAYYSDLGEEAAKAEFADGTMPELPSDLAPQLPAGVSPDSVS